MERFWEKVDQSGGPEACWPWMAYVKGTGYGQFWYEGRDQHAHRVAYQLVVGPIPEGAEIDHVRARGCTRKDCVNPAHLEAVTHRENTLRSDAPVAANARKTHCEQGHEFTPENTYVVKGRYQRQCRTCKREAWRRWKARVST